MHTATRLAVDVARRIRSQRPSLPLASYGLYAAMAADADGTMVFDRAIVGEYEATLVEWLGGAPFEEPISIHLDRGGFRTPNRSILPSLDVYARLMVGGETRLAGAVEASHGRAHMCRHCPIPAVYEGTFRVVEVDTVLSDIDRLVAAGARHITFGDPDFLKIDAEGAEGPILEGMTELIQRSHPAISLEVGDGISEKTGNKPCRENVNWLLDLGYAVYDYRKCQASAHQVADSYTYDNLLFRHPEWRFAALGSRAAA